MKMKAIVFEKYGPPTEVLGLKEVEKPTPKENEVLVKVHAATVNYADWAYVRGKPFMIRLSGGIVKPKFRIPGSDLSGKVEAVGRNVKKFQPGDEVFGTLGDCGFGAYAEFVSVPLYKTQDLTLKPTNITFKEAATVPQAAVVSLQALRDKGQIQSGHKVLINGASGGNGIFAVQLAKYFGAEVTGVCSTKKMDLVRSIGADHVVDYTQEDFTQKEKRYDLILDIVANRSVRDYTRVLTPKGNYVAVAFNSSALFLGPLISMTGGKKAGQFSHKPYVEDLDFIKGLIDEGKIVPVLDKSYKLNEVAEAIRHYGEGHPQGKVVITIAHNSGLGD
jgi:NADPH:quinone reductase-like Zn-dependent oxidoreductase